MEKQQLNGSIILNRAIKFKKHEIATLDFSKTDVSATSQNPCNWTETGYRLLGTSSEYFNIAEYVHAHHERWDELESKDHNRR